MKNLNNDLFDLIFSHISIANDFLDKNKFCEQLDYLTFWVNSEKMWLNSPFNDNVLRDNPNWENTIYDNVYQLVEDDKIVLQYVQDWCCPVAILQRYKMKTVNEWEKRKISVYGKWLRLYYCGLLDWLPDYINLYCDKVIRADLCWDCKDKISSDVILKLWNTVTYGEWENRTYKWFWNKRSPLFIRIYDKTLDLSKDHNSMAWLYPERYTTSCRRIECKFTWRYAESMSALEWLWIVDWKWCVQKIKNSKRDYLKSAFYNMLMYIDFIPDRRKQFELLDWIKTLVNKKLKKLKDFISLDCEND